MATKRKRRDSILRCDYLTMGFSAERQSGSVKSGSSIITCSLTAPVAIHQIDHHSRGEQKTDVSRTVSQRLRRLPDRRCEHHPATLRSAATEFRVQCVQLKGGNNFGVDHWGIFITSNRNCKIAQPRSVPLYVLLRCWGSPK